MAKLVSGEKHQLVCVYIYINFIDFLTVLYIHDKAILGDRMKYPELDNS